MRRWNGWGDDTVSPELAAPAREMLSRLIGETSPPVDISFEDALALVPKSRLPAHPLVTDDAEARLLHCRGQSLPDWLAMRSGLGLLFPDGLARPSSDAEVRALLAYAGEVGAKVIPYGGGTSVVGHVNPLESDAPVLTLSLERLASLRHVDARSRLATFGAGVRGPDLERQLEVQGLTLGHKPQSFELSTLGGWIVTRSCGQQSLCYGRIEDLFAGGTLETPEGTLVLPPFPGSAAGPDIRQMVLGSEGRAGVLTEATVQVMPLPEAEEFHALFFPDFERAQAAARHMAQARLPLSMVRLSTAAETATSMAMAGRAVVVGAIEGLLALRGARREKCMVVIGATGQRGLVRTALKEALSLAVEQNGIHLGQTMGRAWKKNRYKAPYLRNTLWDLGYAVDTLETAATWTGLTTLLEEVEGALRTALEGEGEQVHVFSHLSHVYPSGANLYTTYIFRLASEPEATEERWRALKGAASRAIVDCGATISHQHGVGVDHRPYLEAEKGELGMRVIAELARSFDPQGLMNPGKLID